MLRFKAEASVLEVVPRIKLDPGLSRSDAHNSAGFRIFDATHIHHCIVVVCLQDEVVVVTIQLRIQLIEAVADTGRFREIERRTFHRSDLAGRYEAIISGCVMSGAEFKNVVANITVSREIEIRVIGEVDNGGFVALRLVIDAKLIFVSEGVSDFHLEIPWVIFFAILAVVRELNRGLVFLGHHRFSLPMFARKTRAASMQMILPVVGGQFVFDPVQRELRVADTIGKTANHRRRPSEASEIFIQGFRAEEDIRGTPLAIQNLQFADDRSVLHHFGNHPVFITEREYLYRRAILQLAEGRFLNSGERGRKAGSANRNGNRED